MFNGYNETPLISYNEFDQERDKKGENVSKCSFMQELGAQTTPNNCQEFWSGKPNFLGIPHISKCNCSGCYPSTESLSYQGESSRHRPWLPTSFPFNGSGEWCKLPGYHQWENVGVANQSFPDNKVQYLHQEGKHPFYRHYASSRLSEFNQRGVITSVKDPNKLRQKTDGQNGTRQPVFCNPGCNFPTNPEKRIDNRNYCDPNEKYSNVDPYRHSYSVDQHMPRLPVVEPHIKAVPSNLSENRVPSTGHQNVKENAAQCLVDQGYIDPKKMVGLEKNPRAAYPSGKEGPVLENFLHPGVDFKNSGVVDHRSFYEPEAQKLLLENTRHAEFFGNMPDVIKRNNQTPAIDVRKDCAVGQTPKYLDLTNGKNSCAMFYPKEFNGDKLPESCYQSSGDLTKNKNILPRSTLFFNDRFLEKPQNSFPYQNNPSDYRNYPRPDYAYQGYTTQGLYDYSSVPQYPRSEMNQYAHRQQQQLSDQFVQNNNTVFNSQYQQPEDKTPQQFYPEKSQSHLEEVAKNNYLETIRTKEINKNNKISPLRLLRKKKFVNQSIPEPVVTTPNATPTLDVRKFWSTWAEEEEENVAPTQMVVLDCQNIDPEQAKLLHLYENDPFRTVHLQGDGVVALKNSEDQFEVKSSEQTTLVKDPVISDVGIVEQVNTPVCVTAELNNSQRMTETIQNAPTDTPVQTDPKPCKRGRSSASQDSKDTIRHKKLNAEKETSRLDKWTEKKFDFLKRAEESRAAEMLRHEEEKKKIFESRLTFQDSESKQTEDWSPVEEAKTLGPIPSERPSFLDDNSQSTSPSISDADLPDLPTSEYRRNKFLDYSDRKVIVGSSQNESEDVKDSDGNARLLEEIKKEQDIKLEPAAWLLGSNKLGKSESESSCIKEETGFEIEDIMKKMSEINVESSEVKPFHGLKKNKKPKKPKKMERKDETEERTEKLTVENISVSKPTIKFSIQKSHDLKISFKVLNSSNKKYENSGSDEKIERKEVERTDDADDGEKNTTELITLRLKSIQRDSPNSDRRQRDGDSKENKRKFRRKKIFVEKNQVKKSRGALLEKEKQPTGLDCEDVLNVSRRDENDFQVQETVDSAKIKLTFKRHKTNYETGYRINKKSVGKMQDEGLGPGAGEFFTHRESDNEKSRRRRDDCEASVESLNTNIDDIMPETDSTSNSISKEESTTEEDLKNFPEEENSESGKLTFPVSPVLCDSQFIVSSSEGKLVESLSEEGKESADEQESIILKNNEVLSFDTVESAMEEDRREEISLDCNGSISTKEIDVSLEVDKSEEVNFTMFSTNETNHSESESSYKLNSDKDTEESEAPQTATENNIDLSENNLANNFLIIDDDKNIVVSNSNEEIEKTLYDIDSGESVVQCNEQALSEDLSLVNSVMICEEMSEVSAKPTEVSTSTSESLLTTPIILSPISQNFDQPIESQSVLPDTSELDVLLNEVDKKPELEEGEIVDSSDEEVENAVVLGVGTPVKEETKILFDFKLEKPRKITRTQSLLLEDVEESHKRREHKAKSCPPVLTFKEVEIPGLDVPVEDIPLPPGDPPPENSFDLSSYLKKARIEAKEKITAPVTNQIHHQSPIELSNSQIRSKPGKSQNFSPLKNFKIKFSISKRKCFNLVKSKIEDFDWVGKNKEIDEKPVDRPNKEIHKADEKEEVCESKVKEPKEVEKLDLGEVEEEKEVEKLDMEEEKKAEDKDEGEEETKELEMSDVRQEAKDVQKLDMIEDKKEEINTSSPTVKIVEETNTVETTSSENNSKTTIEKDILEINGFNKDTSDQISEDFELKFMNISFLEPAEGLRTEDVEFEEVDLKTVEMMDEPIAVNFDNSSSVREEFYECEDIPTSEDLPIDMDVEKVSDDDKFRNIMQNCLDNAKKFFNVGNLKLFSCSVDDLLELDSQAPYSNLNENEPDTLTNHFSRDVLLTSCEETVTDDLGLSENFQPGDMSMDFVPSFASDAPHNLCPEILPVDNWPYLEEEVPSSPTKSKPEETDLIPIEGSVCQTHENSHKNDFWSGFDQLNHDKIKRMFPNTGNFKLFRRRSLMSEAKTIRRLSTIPRRNTIGSFTKDFLSYEKKNLKKEATKPKNGVDKRENFWKSNSTLKCRLSLEKLANRNRHKSGDSFEKPTEVSKKIPYHKSPSWQPRVMLSRIPKSEVRKTPEKQSCAEEKSTSDEVVPDCESIVKHVVKIQNSSGPKNEFPDGKLSCLDHNANEDRKKVVETSVGLLREEATTKGFELGIDPVKASSTPEISKPKKPRFRNLYTKERREHDLKKTKVSSAQSTKVVYEKSVSSELLKGCDSPRVTTGGDIRGKSTTDVDEKTKSEERTFTNETKSSTFGASPHRAHDKVPSKSSLSCDKTKTHRTKEESKHRKGDGEKHQSRHDHHREKSSSRSKHSKHEKHRRDTSRERKERSPEGKRHSEESPRKNPEKGRSVHVEEKEKPGSEEKSPVDPWKCQVCGFSDASERIAHIKSHPFHCQSCHLAFETETYFVNHLTRKHKDIRNQHHCLLCELSFDTEKQYQRHLETREHTHLESVEKNTINTLFTLLTGQPCPVLGLVDIKPEWLPNQPGTVHFYHQATPLSLALQYLKMHHDLTSYSTVSSVHPN